MMMISYHTVSDQQVGVPGAVESASWLVPRKVLALVTAHRGSTGWIMFLGFPLGITDDDGCAYLWELRR